MSISVVLACYNGEKRILRQLDSLRNQTIHADEVLIYDDCSSDHTYDLIRKYIKKHRLNGWYVKSNSQNMGWKKCFFKALTEAKGDYVLFCDQDDEWEPAKIKKMLDVTENNPQIGLLACDFEIRYHKGSVRMKKYRKKKAERMNRICSYLFTSRFFQNPAPGCTCLVRRNLVEDVKEYWFPEAPYDEFLWLMASLQDKAWFLNEKLMRMNRYESNASDIRYKDITIQQSNLKYIEEMLVKMLTYSNDHSGLIEQRKINILNQALVWCKKRQTLMQTRNPLRWITMFPYWKYYNSFQNCLSDLYLVLFGSFKRK